MFSSCSKVEDLEENAESSLKSFYDAKANERIINLVKRDYEPFNRFSNELSKKFLNQGVFDQKTGEFLGFIYLPELYKLLSPTEFELMIHKLNQVVPAEMTIEEYAKIPPPPKPSGQDRTPQPYPACPQAYWHYCNI